MKLYTIGTTSRDGREERKIHMVFAKNIRDAFITIGVINVHTELKADMPHHKDVDFVHVEEDVLMVTRSLAGEGEP